MRLSGKIKKAIKTAAPTPKYTSCLVASICDESAINECESIIIGIINKGEIKSK